MRLVKSAADEILAGDVVTTFNWSASSDGKLFTVREVFADDWFLCTDAQGRKRQFAKEHVKKFYGEES